MRRARPTVGTAGALLAIGLAAGGVHAFPDDSPGFQRKPLDLAAAALTGPGSPHVVQDAQLDARSSRRTPEVDTTSSASSTCDGCTADATALHVVYLDRPTEATLDNVGVAWSQCADCRSTALSVQVVVLRSPQTIRANNRALALNALCERCQTAAAAFQIVVAGGRKDRLSRAAHRELEEWVAQQAAALRGEGPGVASLSRAAGPTGTDPLDPAELLDQLDALVSDDLGGARTLERDADVRGAEPVADADPSQTPAESDRSGSAPGDPGTRTPRDPSPEVTRELESDKVP